jgi:hypothetical protein
MEAAGISPQATGGPDDFGYTWDDSVTFNWIDATEGTDTGLTSCENFASVPIGFSFKFYENTYDTVYVSWNGHLTFDPKCPCCSPSLIPTAGGNPDNLIAPYWTHFISGSGRIRYLQQGSPPNRSLVIEWNQMRDLGGNEFTFEAILYENGNILFQYRTMTYSGSSPFGITVGIEDSSGTDGLCYICGWGQISNNKAVLFRRPAPSARVKVYPPYYQGRFTRAGAMESFQVPIRNTGELGADTYDLYVSSSWLVSLYAADGTTPLTDTDGDGTVDTGSVAQGSTVTITVKVQTPAGANIGDYNFASITIRSSLDTSKSKIVTLQTAIPAPFAQVYRDNADGAMSLYLVQPAGQAVKKVAYDIYGLGYRMAVAEAPNSNFIYAWNRWSCGSACSIWVAEIEYALLDRYGNVVRPVSKLTDHSGATMDTYDRDPAIAVAPNGRIGVLWQRELRNKSTSQSNYNIWFAILDSSGNRVYGPVNLTNNTAWGTWGKDYSVPWFWSPRIAATGDNRFILAWQRESLESAGWLEDIYYAVRDASGAEVKPVTKFTNGVAGYSMYVSPGLAALSNNRALLAYNGPGGILYVVLDSSGNIVKSESSTHSLGWAPDVVQLSSGNIVLAWHGWISNRRVIQFTVLSGTNYNPVAGPTTLNNPIAPTGDGWVSVAADAAGHAILTWMDYEWLYNLYYALVDGNGNVLTPPMSFRTSQAYGFFIETSAEGYGNTSYSWTPPSGVDGVAASSASLFGGPPGGNAGISIRYANYGTTTATHVVLTATLGSGLTYVSDTSGVVPTVSGNNVVWNMPDLGFLESRDFTLYVQVPSGAAYGTRYPVTLTLTSDGPEANFVNNTATAEVMAARQVFLPLVLRNYR